MNVIMVLNKVNRIVLRLLWNCPHYLLIYTKNRYAVSLWYSEQHASDSRRKRFETQSSYIKYYLKLCLVSHYCPYLVNNDRVYRLHCNVDHQIWSPSGTEPCIWTQSIKWRHLLSVFFSFLLQKCINGPNTAGERGSMPHTCKCVSGRI